MSTTFETVERLKARAFEFQNQAKWLGTKIVHLERSDENGPLDKKLKYFKMPNPSSFPLDLNEGLHQYIKRGFYSNEKQLSHTNNFIFRNPSVLIGQIPESLKIFTSRSCLLSITFGLLKNLEFEVFVTKYKGCVFIVNQQIVHTANPSETHHFKLHQFCLTDDPNSDPVTDVPVNENEQTFAVYNARFGIFDITYSCEIVGVEANQKINEDNLEEVNESQFVMTKINLRGYYKTWKTLFQAYWTNTQYVYVADKDKLGFIREPFTKWAVGDLQKSQKFEINKYLGYLYSFLEMMSEELKDVDCPYTVHKFYLDKKEGKINFVKYENKNENSFLSQDLIQLLKDL